MSVRVSPISRGAAILIILVGVLTFLLAADAVGEVAGLVFVALGVGLYVLLYRFTRRLGEELAKVEPQTSRNQMT
jgi:membrane protein implicated in regulation of membrane protease activity